MSRPQRIRKAALSLTSSAIQRLSALIHSQPQPVDGIRLSVRTRGCNGLAYTMNYVTADERGKVGKDEVVEAADGVKVFVDPKALFYVVGSEMDYKDDELSSEFTFKNPNEKGKCGCGESFNV